MKLKLFNLNTAKVDLLFILLSCPTKIEIFIQ